MLHPTFAPFAALVFRQLPESVRRTIRPAHVHFLLRVKTRFMEKLTYTDKCLLTENDLVGLLYEQLYWRTGFTLGNIAAILKAEDASYGLLLEQQEEWEKQYAGYETAA